MTLQLANVVPSAGTKLAPGSSIQFDVLHDDLQDPSVKVTVSYERLTELAFDGSFIYPYATSSRVSIAGGWRYTLKRTGSWPVAPTVQVAYLGWPQSGLVNWAVTPAAMTSLEFVGFDVSSRAQKTGAATSVTLAIDGTKAIVPGVEIVRLIKAGSLSFVSSVPQLFVPSDWGPDDVGALPYPSHWDTPLATSDYLIVVQATGTDTFTSIGRNVGVRETTLPTITSATINAANLDRLILNMSVASLAKSAAGLTLSIPGVNVASVHSGQNTSTLVFQLSAPVDISDEPVLTVGAARSVQKINGPLIATGSHSVAIVGGHSTTDLTNLSMRLRHDLGITGGGEGNPVDAWASTGGGTVNMSAAGSARPTQRVTLQEIDFDGTDDTMTSAQTTTTLFGADGLNFYICGRIKGATTTVTADGYNVSPLILGDSTQWWALYFREISGTTVELVCQVFAPSSIVVKSSAITKGDTFYFAVRSDGSTLKMYLNGVETASQAMTAAIGGVAGTLLLGGGSSSVEADVDIWEIAACTSDVGGVLHAAQMAYYAGLP